MESLPTELLIEIFAFGSALDAYLTPTLAYVPFPLRISHVCAHWRAISLSNPRLWTTIVSTKDAPYFPTLKLQLERAGPCPLDLYLDFNEPETWIDFDSLLRPVRPMATDPNSANWIVDEEYGSSFWLLDSDRVRLRLGLLTVSRNVRTYHLSTDIYEYIVMALCFFPLATLSNPLASSHPVRAAALEDVKIEYRKVYEDPSRWGTVFLPINDEVAPNLRQLRLRGLGLDIGGGSLVGGGVGVTGLTMLELRDTSNKPWFSVTQLRATLASNPALTTLALENAIPHATGEEWGWAWSVDERITLVSLTKLVFSHHCAGAGEEIFRRLRFPSLNHLEIDLWDGPAEDSHDAVLRLLIPLIGPSLHTLRLEEIRCTSATTSALLSSLSTLRILALNFNHYEDIGDESNSFVPWSFAQSLSDALVEMTQKKLGRVWEMKWRPLYMPKLQVLVLGGISSNSAQEILCSRPGADNMDVFVGSKLTNELPGKQHQRISRSRKGTGTVEFRDCEWRGWTSVDVVSRKSKLDLFDFSEFLRRLRYI